MLPHHKLLAAILISSLLTAGCLKGAVKTLGELQALQNALTNKFGDETNVHLSEGVNRGMLSVTFINSPLNNGSTQQRALRAQETARIVGTYYAGSTLVNSIVVVFLRRQTQFVVFHRAKTVDSFGFEKDGQPTMYTSPYLPGPVTNSGITAGYSSEAGQTDISANTFQIDGETGGYGITILAHFILPGNATRKQSPPPEEVSFNISSYSKKPRFSGLVPVEIISDGKPVMQGKLEFSGKDAQYCNVKFSYSVFRRMIAGKDLAIKLGAKKYPLTPEQIALLRKMDAYVLE